MTNTVITETERRIANHVTADLKVVIMKIADVIYK